MNNKISQQCSFTVNASFGTELDKLNTPGSLEYNSSDLFISSNSHNLQKLVASGQLVYGIGSLLGTDENQKEIITPVHLTLDGFSPLISRENITDVGEATFNKYQILSSFIGDFFVNKETKFKDIIAYLTNFSNWLSSDLNNPKYSLQDHDKFLATVKTPDTPNMIAKSAQNKNLQLMRGDSAFNAKNSLTSVTSSVVVNNYIQLKAINGSISQLLLVNQQINSWYNLITGTTEKVYKIIGTRDDPSHKAPQEVQLFNSNSCKVNFNDFSYITTFIRRTKDLYQNCIDSLNTWINSYDALISIYNSIKPNQPGELDQQLQNECVALQLIFDTFYEPEYRKKKSLSKDRKINYKCKVNYVLKEKIDSDMLNKATKKYEPISNDKDFITQIKDIRNTLSHSSTTREHVPLENRSVLHALLRIIIRDWLLSKIGIQRNYINAEYFVNKPFNFSVIHTW
ncbi:HEPN domain-containing protein [Secundilactobacillus yichangensis]|uniref:HEPN domain-containing protein n=1 Tax=Secundilactobacillus yichangensis TaxID=2799580 RepID=UPI0019431AC5|nr:HEPN domain-containing protein [Secundilactobacillus yichangensis]